MQTKTTTIIVPVRECNPGTRVPKNPGKPGRFQTCKPGFEIGQKPGLRV